jgi:hypothetical protein
MVDYLKENDNQPVILIPQFTRPNEKHVTRLDADNIDIQDVFGYQPNVDVQRRLSATLPLEPIYFRN